MGKKDSNNNEKKKKRQLVCILQVDVLHANALVTRKLESDPF